MSAGLGVFLLALGAVLAFAVNDSLPGIDLITVGYICMGAGILTLILSLILMSQNRRRPTTRVEDDRATPPTERFYR